MVKVNSAFVLRAFYHFLLLVLILVKVIDWNCINASYGR